ncbi:hypothetical protein FS749_013730 [Ceratobasidium sp. UAMH 11750]|nr:hypothetical protein FS749_013730 [Ceratobasidium sp. UAMH 11750]
MIRALLDFSYLAHGAQLTDDELTEMDNALAAFHKAKYVLIALKTYTKRRQFDQIPKLHIVGHYPNDIRELGAPDGFSTETPEHLHIVYVKIPWSMSNRRDPMPQVVDYYYGDGDEIDLEDDEIYGDDQDESESDVGEEEISGDESDEDDEGDMVQVALEEMSEPERSEIYYPRPVRSIAKQPTIPRVPGHVLISSYHATDLIRALRRFLLPIAQRRGEDLILLPSDHFNVWHKLTLDHSCLPFAPNQPCHRDVVRAHPAVRDATGWVTTAGVFNTVLFSVDPEGIGLNRYRAGRVCAMFTLPPSLQHLYPYPLAYVEFFTPFVPDATSHRLYRTSQAYLDGHRAFAAFPLSWIVMACYIAPDFSSSSTPAGRFDISSPAYTGRDFVFNDFYNYFTYLLMAYWQRSVSTRLS